MGRKTFQQFNDQSIPPDQSGASSDVCEFLAKRLQQWACTNDLVFVCGKCEDNSVLLTRPMLAEPIHEGALARPPASDHDFSLSGLEDRSIVWSFHECLA